jgi:hypothetical protein
MDIGKLTTVAVKNVKATDKAFKLTDGIVSAYDLLGGECSGDNGTMLNSHD